MFERILSIDNNSAKVKISNNFNVDILNYHVVFEDSEKKILGIVNEINNNDTTISFLGTYFMPYLFNHFLFILLFLCLRACTNFWN